MKTLRALFFLLFCLSVPVQAQIFISPKADISGGTNLTVTPPITLTGDTVGVTQNAGTDITADLEEESHAAEHQHSGADEVATATPAANAIPKAGAGGTLTNAWTTATSSNVASSIVARNTNGDFIMRDLDLRKLLPERAALQTLVVADAVDCSWGNIIPVVGSGGAVDLTSNPQVLAGTKAGQHCIIEGTSNTNTLKLDDATGLSLQASRTLGDNQMLALRWDGTVWVEETQEMELVERKNAASGYAGLTASGGLSTLAQGTLTADAHALSSTATWNNAGVTFTHWKANVTDTASAAASLLADLQVGGVSKWKVDKTGVVTQTGQFLLPDGTEAAPSIARSGDVTDGFWFLNNRAMFSVNGIERYRFQDGDVFGIRHDSAALAFGLSLDTQMIRDAANTLAVRNGVNAQTLRVTRTFTDLPNRADAEIVTTGTTVEFKGTETGTGGLDDVIFGQTAMTSRVRSSLATPATLVNGDWWVDCSGTSPSRVCAMKVQDGGATRTIASITY